MAAVMFQWISDERARDGTPSDGELARRLLATHCFTLRM